jgi:pimeloyl-ACP methyl ester carboxylesterase
MQSRAAGNDNVNSHIRGHPRFSFRLAAAGCAGIIVTASLCGPTAIWADDTVLPATHPPARRPVHLLAVLIGGIDSDPTPAQIDGTAERSEGNSGLYRFAGDIARHDILPEYFNWNGTRAGKIQTEKPPGSRGIADFVRAHLQTFPGDRVAIAGNSWGGHTALEAARELSAGETPLAIDLVVFLDPSSTGRGPVQPKALPVNVNRAVSYSTRNMFTWGKWHAGKRLEYIDLGDPDNHFMRDGEPAYNAKFDMRAHIAAEWDENIHSDIKQRLLKLLPRNDDAVTKTAEGR